MSPHSLIDSSSDVPELQPVQHSQSANGNGISHVSRATNGHHQNSSRTSNLQSTDSEELHDLICAGFGPASLAIAVALHDSVESGNLRHRPFPKVTFLEKQSRFAWHAGMLLPGAKMQISFIKDMASLRDPRSQFTFLNYLHQNGRLVEFTNLSTFLPARSEYEDYLRWCASHFDDVVKYSTEVVSIAPESNTNGEKGISIFTVTSRNVVTGEIIKHRARNVVLAVGGQPSIPKCLPAKSQRVIHSSRYAHEVPQILNSRDAPYRVAVVGAGQSAAEIFNNVQTLYPNSKTYLIMRQEFLKPSDDSPFVNSIFNPDYVDYLYPRSAKYRKALLTDARSTNYGVVRLELIEKLYERMYDQKREIGSDETQWPHRILPAREIVSVEDQAQSNGPLRLRLASIEDGDSIYTNGTTRPDGPINHVDESIEVDLIITATGYRRNAHLQMMEDAWSLLPESSAKGSELDVRTVGNESLGRDPRPVEVTRDYQVKFAPGKVANGSGVWLQGCCEGTHGLSDTLLSVLATRSSELVSSIFGEAR